MSRDFESFIVDPSLLDPSIDATDLRTTTDTRQELLSNIPDYAGIKFDPTQASYLDDLYGLYSGQLPMTPVTPAATTPAVGSPANGGGGGGENEGGISAAPITPSTPITTDLTDEQINEFAMPTDTYGITSDPIKVEDLQTVDGEQIGSLGTIPGRPVIGDFDNPTTGTISDDILNEVIGGQPMAAGPFDYLQQQTPISQVQVPGVTQADITQGKIDEERLPDYTPSFEKPEQEKTVKNILGKAGQTVQGALTELGKIPGAIVDFTNQTVDVFGKQLNVGKTLAGFAISSIVGGPVGLVFNAITSKPSASQLEYEGYNDSQKDAIDEAYGPGGVMDGYNAVSAFGKGALETIQDRLEERTSNGIFDATTDKLNELAEKLGGTPIDAPAYENEAALTGGDPITDAPTNINNPFGYEDPIDDDFDGPSVDTGPVGPQFEDIDYADPGVDAEENQPGGDGPGTSSGPSGPTGNYEGAGVGGPAGQGSPQSTGPTDRPGGADAGTESFGNENVGGSPTGISGPPSQGGTATTGPSGPPSQGGGGGGDGCFLAGTLVTMADGSTKPVEQVDLKDNVAEGGKVFATGKFLVENLYDYKGIKVSGSHMVNEDNKWVRVENSKHGKPLGDDEHTVYVFGSENRRILINGILFTDYFEVKEQEKFLEDEKKFFKNWKQFSNEHNESNVNILNAS